MRQFLIDLLKALEVAVPPPSHCHHVLSYARYGSDEAGWSDELALQINKDGVFHCFFLDDDDLSGSVPCLIDRIFAYLNSDGVGQLGVGTGQYVK